MSEAKEGASAVARLSRRPIPAEMKLIPSYVATSRVGDMLSVSTATVRRLIESGTLEAIRVGHVYRVKRSSLMRFLGYESGGEADV